VEAAAPAKLLTVTLNAALDLTYAAGRLSPGSSHRTPAPQIRSGGKGINVARVAAALGADVVATGLAGGPTGAMIRAGIPGAGLTDGFLSCSGDSRRTITIVEADGRCTAISEAGPVISEQEWARFERHFAGCAGEFQAVALSGSLPPGVPGDAYARLVRIARGCGVPVILDTSGEALLAGLPARPDIIKPNRDELAGAMPGADAGHAAHRLRSAGAGTVVASLGSEGMLAVTAAGCWRARPPAELRGNPTGAGDACVAGLLLGIARGLAWPDMVRLATALSAAAVASPVAGEVDAGLVRELHPDVPVDRACH
jgi:tagatose 6-phosphate kinase